MEELNHKRASTWPRFRVQFWSTHGPQRNLY